jgi:LysM repeat protein
MKNRQTSGGFTVRLQTISLLALFVTLLFVAPAHAQDDGATGSQAAAQQILADVNQARTDNGLPPLAVNEALTLAAQRHVDDVIANGNWGHYGSDGTNVQMRVARAGYGTSAVSENWVAVSSPEQAIVWWMNDWIHRVNILGGHWDEIGVGAGVAPNGFWIFVTDFGNPDGGPPVYITTGASATADTGATVMSVPAGGLEYAVQSGDTLLGIAIRYGLDWQDIAIANNLGENDLLQIGQMLHLPSIGGIGGPVEEIGATAVAGKQRYTVAAGDTLFTIALRYNITWQEIAAANGLQEFDLLQIGQEIALPASLDEETDAEAVTEEVTEAATEEVAADEAEATPKAPVAGASFEGNRQRNSAANAYTVRAGDTPLGIALSHSITLNALLRANGLTESDFLQIGQTLTIPGVDQQGAPAAEEVGENATPSAATETYTVRSGDTVFAVAIRLEVDWQEILRVNNLTEQSLLQPGQTLIIP